MDDLCKEQKKTRKNYSNAYNRYNKEFDSKEIRAIQALDESVLMTTRTSQNDMKLPKYRQ